MLAVFKKLSNEEWFMVVAFLAIVLVSFMLGYTVFRYWQIEVCKPPINFLENKST